MKLTSNKGIVKKFVAGYLYETGKKTNMEQRIYILINQRSPNVQPTG
jgi:hypothetical protein